MLVMVTKVNGLEARRIKTARVRMNLFTGSESIEK